MVKITKTLQLQLFPEDTVISDTLHQTVDALNYISHYAKENNQFQAIEIHNAIYLEVREKFQLRSQMAESAIRAVASQYKGKKKTARKHKEPVAFKQSALSLNYPRDYRIIDHDTVSINTIVGRKKIRYDCGEYQRELLKLTEWKVRSAIVCERKRDHKIFLNIAIEKTTEDVMTVERNGFVGVDVGINKLAVTTNSNNQTKFYTEGHVQYIRYKYQQIRQSCQSKDTRSAKRRLIKISGRERRFVTNTNHCISKQIVTEALHAFSKPIIVLEDLTGIRKNPRRSKKGRYQLNTWAFYQVQQFIAYKAVEKGVPVMWINPEYTSQACPKCGHIEQKNRDKKLHRFRCRKCKYQSNDDRVGSINIRNRGVVPWYIRSTRGICQVP
jgi:IS605 OrfB family transposase